jgi:Short C-terminal domain
MGSTALALVVCMGLPKEVPMRPLTSDANSLLQDLAQRYGVSFDAALSMLYAVSSGGGTMAQFNVPELGGSGQWMQGGMTMVGDMFNYGLQSKVSGLCSELSNLLRSHTVFAPQPVSNSFGGGSGFGGFANNWWPNELGQPSSSGGQNDSRYAYFPHVQRLAIDRAGQVTIYDALDHQIGGVQQQQGGSYGTLSFTSQWGTFTVDSLPIVSGVGKQQQPQQPAPVYAPAPVYNEPASMAPPPPALRESLGEPRSQSEVLNALERLGDLHQKGILSEAEFQSKKAELLSRL